MIGAKSGRSAKGRRLSAVFAVGLSLAGYALALECYLLSVCSSLRSWRKTSLVVIARILSKLSSVEAILQRTMLL